MMYSRLYQFARKQLLLGHQTIRRSLNELDRTQWLSSSELAAQQFRKLQELVNYAYEYVPFYRERYQRERIRPQDIRSYEDFRSLPILTRDDVRNHLKELFSKGFRGEVFEGHTSGSTGRPMPYLMEKATAYWSYAAETRCRAWYEVYPGDKMARFLLILGNGSGKSWKSQLGDRLKRYRWLDPRNLNEQTMKAFADVLVKWRPIMLRVYPSALTIFAKYLQEQGISGINPRLIESTGEKVTPSQRKLFEDVFRAPTVDHYSSLEIYSIAYQCPQGSLHVLEDRYLELLENGKVVGPGQTGDVTMTSLNQHAMPFIRYQNGDMGIYEPKACSCGRSMPVLREISGRKWDVFVRPDGQPVHWARVYAIMMHKHEIYQYQMYQPDRSHLEVSLVCKQNVDPLYLENLRKEMQPLFGDSAQISMNLVNDLVPARSGKRLFFISDVKPDSPIG